MKKMIFLKRLHKEGKLKLTTPSENVKDSYIEKAESNLISAKILLENDRLEEAISLAYYCMYNAVLALLFRTGIKSENHVSSIILLQDIFEIDNTKISDAKKERIDKQYYPDFHIAKEEVKEAIKESEDFNKVLFDFIAKITNENIKEYRKQFSSLIK